MAKYNIKKTKKLKFARFGGLSSVNQRGYDANDTDFHAPPCSRGFYAFVWPYYEFFLLGADCTKDPKTIGSKFSYVRDKSGNVVNDNHPDFEKLSAGNKYWSVNTEEYNKFFKENETLFDENYDEYSKKYDAIFKEGGVARSALVQKPPPKIFEYGGDIWHHLGGHLKQYEIIGRKGDWVKSSIDSYRTALESEMHAAHKESLKWFLGTKYGPKDVMNSQTALRRMSKDHLEVFIEKL